MEIYILASGSKGNVTYFETNHKRFLIDAGITFSNLNQKMKAICKPIENVDTLLITHEHIDHIKGLKVLLKQGFIQNVFLTKGTLDALGKDIQDLLPLNTTIIRADESFYLEDIQVLPIMLSHDANEPVGFTLYYKDKKVVLLTDTGYVDDSYDDVLRNADLYILEANHDPYKLMHSSRPFMLKKRILGETGHLSNEDAAILMNRIVEENHFAIWVAAHISEDCNSALDIEEAIVKIFDDPTKIELKISSQETLEKIKLWLK